MLTMSRWQIWLQSKKKDGPFHLFFLFVKFAEVKKMLKQWKWLIALTDETENLKKVDDSPLTITDQIRMRSKNVKLVEKVIEDLKREGELSELPQWIKCFARAQQTLQELLVYKQNLSKEKQTRNVTEL